MVGDPNYVPSSCKIGLTLNSVSEVRESEDFITLNAQLNAEISQAQRTFAGLMLRTFNMTQRAHLQQFRKKFAKLLPAAARIFGAELGLSSYGYHQAVVDLLARHSDAILSPLNITLIGVLVLYRDANELAIIPSPTVLNNIHHVIAVVNGPRPGEDALQLQEPPAATMTNDGNHPASFSHQFQLAISPDEEQAAAAAAAGPVAAAVAAVAADYAEHSTTTPAAIQAPTPSNSTPRSAVRNPYTRNGTPASSLPHPVQLTERITLSRLPGLRPWMKKNMSLQ